MKDKTSPYELNDACSAAGALPQELEALLGQYAERVTPMDLARSVRSALSNVLARQPAAKTPMARALARGIEEREEMKAEEGGHVSAEEAARLLRISKPAVLSRFDKGQVLGWREGRQNAVRFPVWQFTAAGLLAGLEPILAALRQTSLDDWGKVMFFLEPRATLKGERPLDLLRQGQTNEVETLALADVQ